MLFGPYWQIMSRAEGLLSFAVFSVVSSDPMISVTYFSRASVFHGRVVITIALSST